MAKQNNPETVTGGCLCGGVRYQVHFAQDHDWKRGPHTCQCTQCRKNTGSLVYYMHTVTDSEITWLSKLTYAEYNSSPGCYRSFCKNCGSPIAWTDHGESTDIEIAVGTMDEQFLVGDRDVNDKPLGAYGVALANPEAEHFYIRNEIPGVTDRIATAGTKFWKNTAGGQMEKTAD